MRQQDFFTASARSLGTSLAMLLIAGCASLQRIEDWVFCHLPIEAEL